jgi:hypothetical protein
MPSVRDEARTKAITSSTDAIETRSAMELKRFWPIVASLARAKGKTLPDDPTAGILGATPEETEQLREEYWKKLSRQMIDERQITVGDANITLDELEEEIQTQGLGISLKKMVPTRRQVDLISGTVGNSVRRNTGTGIDFLDGLLGGASLGNMFMGLFSWIFGGFKGGFDGLKGTIATLTGKDMATDTKRSLVKLRGQLHGTEDDISAFMDNDVIDNVGKEIERAPLDQLKLKGYTPPKPVQIRDVKMGDVGDQIRSVAASQTKTFIEQGLDKAFKETFYDSYTQEELGKDPKTWDSVKEYYSSGRAAIGLPDDKFRRRAILDKVKTQMSERLSTIINDPNYVYNGNDPGLEGLRGKKLSQMSKEDLGLVMEAESRRIILELRNEAAAGSTDYTFYSLLADQVPGQMRAKVVDNYDKFKIIIGGELGQKLENLAKSRRRTGTVTAGRRQQGTGAGPYAGPGRNHEFCHGHGQKSTTDCRKAAGRSPFQGYRRIGRPAPLYRFHAG